MQFKLACKLSFSTIVTLLQLLQLICPMETGCQNLSISYWLSQRSMLTYIHYCATCMKELRGNQPCSCSNNQCVPAEPNCLIQISPQKTLHRIISGKELQYVRLLFIVYAYTITDNWDSLKSHTLSKERLIGTIFNIDGISPFKASRVTIWLAFINLPAHTYQLIHGCWNETL